MEPAVGLTVVEQDAEASRPRVAALTAAVYPPEILAKVPWRNVRSAAAQRRVMVLDRAGAVVCAAGWLLREGLLDGAPVRIGGVGGVMTDPAHQGSGLGRMVMAAVADLMVRRGGVGFALLFCEARNVGFYRKLGWGVFHGVVRAVQAGGDAPYNIMTPMVRPVADAAPTTGTLELRGLPW